MWLFRCLCLPECFCFRFLFIKKHSLNINELLHTKIFKTYWRQKWQSSMSSALEFNFLITRSSETKDIQDNVNILLKKISIIFMYIFKICEIFCVQKFNRVMCLSHLRMKNLKFRSCYLHDISKRKVYIMIAFLMLLARGTNKQLRHALSHFQG